MSYTPTNWQTGDVITAEKLNKLEEGVATLSGYDLVIDMSSDLPPSVTGKTPSEILTDLGIPGRKACVITEFDGVPVMFNSVAVGSNTFDGVIVTAYVFDIVTNSYKELDVTFTGDNDSLSNDSLIMVLNFGSEHHKYVATYENGTYTLRTK